MKFASEISEFVREELLDDVIKTSKQALGEVFVVVDPADTQYGEIVKKYGARGRVFDSLETAYANVVSNRNDMILLNGHGTHDLAAGIDWTKNRVNVIGMDGGDRLVQQGAKVQLGGAIATAYVVKNTGVRNSFRNIKFIQASTNAAALTALQDGGEGSLYKNCTATFGVVNNLGGTTAHEVLAGSDSATFLDCNFGTETLLTSAARSVFHIDQVTASQEFKSNILRGCTFLISSSSATATFVRLDAVGDVLFTNLFDRCNFVASVDSAGGAAIAEAVQTGTGTVKGTLNFAYPATFNVTNFTTATSGRNANVKVIGAVVDPAAATDLVAITPVAT